MDWPSLSPDLNPMENVWAQVARRVYDQVKQYLTLNDLEAAVFEAWEHISLEALSDLVNSMKDRIYNLIKKNGKHTGY